ncbi:alkaline phosphatase [Idiomarina tyrosinivorans]|uniref:Alkaline phosphatase n=1 Tax=Idiomarina tyrosinivorans TaxID=1445662 RepID=A0A432ZTL7_9GAMM|nr:DUF3413 domain-containing protein [Idiomarina tyrosinivorans]RUO81239.1 alkaline phosphatase [Idiomarina tyrosinivorans]
MGKYQRRDKIARLISWGHWFTFTNIILSLAIGTLYIEASEFPTTGLSTIYAIVSWIGHFAFLPFVFFIIAIFPVCLFAPYSRFMRGYASLVSAFALVALISDVIFFRQYGYHLNTYSLAQMARDAETVFTGASFVMVIGILLSFLLILGIELVLANLTWKRLPQLQNQRYGAPITSIFVLCFLTSHSMHVWADAALYDPITQQDDMFPISYPTTAKTLMAKHGLIEATHYRDRQQMLLHNATKTIEYPLNPLLCAKVNNPQQAVIVAFNRLNAEQREALNTVLSPVASGYHRADIQLLGHPEAEGGSFQLLYGLPDFYQQTLINDKTAPAYAKPLSDFGMPMHLLRTQHYKDEIALPENSTIQTLQRWESGPHEHKGLTVLFADISDRDAVIEWLESADLKSAKVMVTALAPVRDEQLVDKKQFQPSLLEVPLWVSNISLPSHPIAGLMDLMPTALDSLMSCANGVKNFSNGESLRSRGERYPLVESYKPYIVIYQQTETTVLDSSGQFSVYDNQGFQLKSGAEPHTSVLINALKKIKRFSKPIKTDDQ